jgi:flagellar hook-associated protein 1 FlgK
VNTTGLNNLKNGDKIYLTQPSASIDGIPASSFGGFFTVSNVSANSFSVTVATSAATGGNFTVAGQTAIPKYSTIEAGEAVRTKSNGTITANVSANTTSPFYTINVNLSVDDGNGNLSRSVVSYVVNNNDTNLVNARYSATAATLDGAIKTPSSLTPVAQAMLVDENGVELAKSNGAYTTTVGGRLKIVGGDKNSFIAIDSLDSVELGRPNDTPKTVGSNRSFSHYFGLNNFFVDDGNIREIKVKGSAAALKVEDRITQNPNLIALGSLTRSPTRGTTPNYTYERNIGDNSIIQKLAKLGQQPVSFAAAGGLGQTQISFGSYAGQIIGAAATNANGAQNAKVNSQTLLDGFSQRSDSVSGVNLDEELANTIIYQNAYSASARIITVVNSLFETLIQSVGN